jgi:DNA-binding transcriptional ArsR family regulator
MELQKDNNKDKGVAVLNYNPDLFHNDQQFYLSYRKIEHIVSAVFLVTGLIEGNDVLKNEIRQHALKNLSQITSLIGKTNVGVSDIQAVAAQLIHLNALLDIGFWSGQVSQMNLSILQKEITTTYETLNNISHKYKDAYFISSAFFKGSDEVIKAPINTLQKDINKDRELKDKKIFRQNNQRQNTAHTPITQSDSNKRQEFASSSTVNVSQSPESSSELPSRPDTSKTERRESILNLLRTHSNLTVKDFTTVVTAYSEKTIQRELLALVDEGIVRKEGERRWSTYSLAT